MARWVFSCRNCGQLLEHAVIPDTLANFYFPAKPVLPDEGISKVCQNCSGAFTYSSNELFYERA
jgi:hypothetical protein